MPELDIQLSESWIASWTAAAFRCRFGANYLISLLVPLAGLEPARLSAPDFERPQMPYPWCIRGYPFSR